MFIFNQKFDETLGNIHSGALPPWLARSGPQKRKILHSGCGQTDTQPIGPTMVDYEKHCKLLYLCAHILWGLLQLVILLHCCKLNLFYFGFFVILHCLQRTIFNCIFYHSPLVKFLFVW